MMTGPGARPSRLELVRQGRDREAAFYEAVLARGAVVAWGDAEGLSPWEDDDGQLLVPLWPDEQAAQEENADELEQGEVPIVLGLEELSDTLQEWLDHEVDAVAVHPVEGHIAATLTLDDFARRLLAADGTSGRRLPEAVRSRLERYVPRLP